MDVKELILKKINNNGHTTSREIIEETGYSRTYVNRFLRELRDEGRIVKIGKANQTRYVLADEESLQSAKKDITHFSQTYENSDLQEDQVLDTIKAKTGIFQELAGNIDRILAYGFTEMLNNAIDHSQSNDIYVRMDYDNGSVQFQVRDYGVGIFNNLKQKHNLKSKQEAIQHLLKGKQTTAPEKHSGEGIFFTSKLADTLTFKSGEKKLQFNNRIDDVFITDIAQVEGTDVLFSIDKDNEKTVQEVFDRYTDEQTYEFSTSEVRVRLYEEGTDYLSRSQARRLLVGLDKFSRIILDFDGVETVGQAFADQVFRVWAHRHPEVKLEIENVTENVELMIERARSYGKTKDED